MSDKDEGKATSDTRSADLESSAQARKNEKTRAHVDKNSRCGKLMATEMVGSKTIRFYEKGYVSVSRLLGKEKDPEKLLDVSVSTNVAIKTGLGRAAAFVATGGISGLSPSMRGNIYLSIATDVTTHFLDLLPPEPRTLRTAHKIEAIGKGLLSRLAQEPSSQISAESDDNSHFHQLEKLIDLHNSGVLSDEEFAAAKKRLLGN